MLHYQFDWPLFLVKCLWQEQGNDFCGYYMCEIIYNATLKNKRGYSKRQYEVRKQKYSQVYFITIISVEFHSHICIDPLLQIRRGRCGMNSYHKIAWKQFKRNWRDSFLTTSSIKPENTMWTLSSYIIRGLYIKRYENLLFDQSLGEGEVDITFCMRMHVHDDLLFPSFAY